ncbi:MAG: hypothetical protein BWY45_03259 [Euryarchaeota archaeon ADurb.Bin294]|nr:MAG: hypothetical protein BWY45_03259 [Euryarchaeota archaeon ADurb.Bin294]
MDQEDKGADCCKKHHGLNVHKTQKIYNPSKDGKEDTFFRIPGLLNGARGE